MGFTDDAIRFQEELFTEMMDEDLEALMAHAEQFAKVYSKRMEENE